MSIRRIIDWFQAAMSGSTTTGNRVAGFSGIATSGFNRNDEPSTATPTRAEATS